MVPDTEKYRSVLLRPKGNTVPVECPAFVLHEICGAALSEPVNQPQVAIEVKGNLFGRNLDINYQLPLSPGEVELGGVLFGRREETQARVLAFRALHRGHRSRLDATLSEEDLHALIALIKAARADRDLQNLEPLGWFRAHPKSPLTLSGRDQELFQYVFNEPWQIGLVLRPNRSAPAKARFFLRDAGGSIRPKSCYRDVIVPVAGAGSTVQVERPIPGRSITHAAPAAVPALSPQHQPASRPPVGKMALILATVLGLTYWWFVAPQAIPQPSSIRHPSATNPKTNDHKQAEQQAAALWKKWQEETRLQIPDAPAPAPPPRPPQKSENIAPNKMPEAPTVIRVPVTPPSVGPAAPKPASHSREAKPGSHSQERVRGRAPTPPPVVHRTPPAAPLHSTPPRAPLVAKAVPPVPLARSLAAPQSSSGASSNPQRVQAIPQPASPPPAPREPPPAAAPKQERPPAEQPAPVPSAVTSPAVRAVPEPAVRAVPVKVAPTSGRLIWTGRLQKNGAVVISGATASTGSLIGELPGKPVKFRIWPGDLTDDGILLYVSNLPGSGRLPEAPGPQNGWNKTIYSVNSRRADDVMIVEAPGPQNDWKHLVLRARNQKLSIVVVDWVLTP